MRRSASSTAAATAASASSFPSDPMIPADETSPSVRIGDLRSPALASLGLKLVAGHKGLDRPIDWPRVQKPGLAIAGFLDYVKPNRVQILGNSEFGYLKTLSPAVARERLDAFTALPLSGVVVTKGIEPAPVARRTSADGGASRSS